MTTGVLQAIPDDLYEAATMDGASAFTRLRTITLPLVLYAIAPIIITQYTFNFNNFNIIYLFQQRRSCGGRLQRRWDGYSGVVDL